MTILYLWTIVAMSRVANGAAYPVYDWRALGQFESMQACKRATITLNAEKYARCVSAATGESK